MTDFGFRGAAIIAKRTWRASFAKRGYWLCTWLGCWYYLVTATILYFLEQASLAAGEDTILTRFVGRIDWGDQFIHGFTYSQLVWLSATLIVGAGAIAEDNKSNLLTVILSRPVTKLGYLLGKWIGVFVPVGLCVLTSAALFYLYGAMNYRGMGFLTDDPWLPARLGLLVVSAAAVHTSLIVGVSSLFDRGRMAGAAYAALYFVGTFFSNLMVVVWVRAHTGRQLPTGSSGDLAERLVPYSVDGLLTGVAKLVLQTDGTGPVFFPPRVPIMGPPPAATVWGLVVLAVVAPMCLAWFRVRAFEVVK